MTRLAAPLLMLAFLTTPCGDARAEIYKWTDAEGRLHFTSDLSQVPRKQRRQAEDGARKREQSNAVQRHSGSARSVPARRAPRRILPDANGQKKTYTVRIPPGGTNMPVMVRLNDEVEAPFIIDTGATDVAVPKRVADELGIETDENTPTKRYRTANGLIDAPVVMLESVSLGGARVENVQASISSSLEIGLLGLSYFNHFQYQVDSVHGLVHLTPNAQAGRAGRSESQWRALFTNLRGQLRTIQDEIERTPSSKSRKLDRLTQERKTALARLAAAEAEADHQRVPFTWRE